MVIQERARLKPKPPWTHLVQGEGQPLLRMWFHNTTPDAGGNGRAGAGAEAEAEVEVEVGQLNLDLSILLKVQRLPWVLQKAEYVRD